MVVKKIHQHHHNLKSKYVFETRLDNGDLVLFHLLSYAIYILKSIYIDYWVKQQYINIPNEIVEELVKNNFIISSEAQDNKIIKKINDICTTKKAKLPYIYLYSSMDCNLQCSYCFQERSNLKLNFEYIDSIYSALNEIKNNCNNEVLNVSLFGGEPLLLINLQHTEYLLNYLNKIDNINVNIVTNGVTIPNFLNMINNFNRIIKTIRVTFYGSKLINNKFRTSNTKFDLYTTILNNIESILMHTDLIVYINILIDDVSIKSISEILDDLERRSLLDNKRIKINFGRIQFRYSLKQEQYDRELSYIDYYSALLKISEKEKRIDHDLFKGSEVSFIGDLYRYLKINKMLIPNLRGCMAVYPGRYCFYPDGFIYPCTELAGITDHAIGSYYPEFKLFENHSKWTEYSPLGLKCKNCKFILLCNGACPATNLSINKNISDVVCLNYGDTLYQFFKQLDKNGFFNEKHNS